jgi:cystathionine beta-lyase/cystathionine gamma-synthase
LRVKKFDGFTGPSAWWNGLCRCRELFRSSSEDRPLHTEGSVALQIGGCWNRMERRILMRIMQKKKQARGAQTNAIHAGEPVRHGVDVSVTTAIVRSSTFTFSSSEEMKLWAEGKSKAYIYSRYGNPTLTVAEKKIASLEGAEDAIVTSSGMAAISHSLLSVLENGDELIASAQLYGGTYRLMRDVFPRMGITVRHVEASLEGIGQLVTPKTKCLYIETPTNPTLHLVDLRKAIAFAKKHKLISIVDNTFATPVLQNPLALGFDMVVHSVTKGLSGHSDLLGGVAAGSLKFVEPVRQMVINLGGCMDPEVAFLLMRGMKTLGVRIAKQCESALRIAKFLEKHRKVESVHYPGLRSHRDHLLAKKQMRGFGSMLAFDLKGGLPSARRFCDRVKLFLLAASLGGVESLVLLPIYSSHYRMSEKELRNAGVKPGSVRVSIGLEDTADLIEDLKQALG